MNAKTTPISTHSTTPAAAAVTATPDVAGNASIAMFAKALYLVTRLLVPPMVLAHVALAEYGLWSACFVLIMYIGITDVGFSNVYVRFVACYHALGDTVSINRLVSTGVITLSVLACIAWCAVWLCLPTLLDFLKVAPDHQQMARVLLLGTSAMFLLDLTLGAHCYLLHGLQRFREEQRVAIAGYLLELACIAAFLQIGLGVYSLLLAFVLRYLWSLSSFIRLAYRFLPTLELRFRHYDRAMLRHFLGFGAGVQASALLSTALFSIDRVLAGFLLGPPGIALFELGTKLPVSAIAVPSMVSNVTMPAAARYAASDDHTAIRALYCNASRATSMLAGWPLGFMAVFAAPIVQTWLGARADLALLPIILTLSALCAHLHIVTGPGSAVYRAQGRVGNEFVYHGLRCICLAIAIGGLMLALGTTAMALNIGLALGGACASFFYLAYNQRQLGLSIGDLLREILLPGFAAYPVAVLLFLVWQLGIPTTATRWIELPLLLTFGLIYSLLYGFTLWRWLLSSAEQERVSALSKRFVTPLMRWRQV